MEWLVAVKFQYNGKRHTATGQILFELSFGRHLWKENLVAQMEFPRLEGFLTELQRSWTKKGMDLLES